MCQSKCLVGLVALFAVRVPVRSEERLIEEMPVSDLVFTQQKGEVQLTFGSWFPRASRWEAPVSLEYGLTSAWEVELTAGGVVPGSGSEGELLELGVRRSFLHLRGTGNHVALGLSAEVEREGEEERRRMSWKPGAVFARDLRSWQGQVFAGVEWNTSAAAEHRIEWAAGTYFRRGPVVLTHEFQWRTPHWQPTWRNAEIQWAPGLVWRLAGEPLWELAFAVPVGLTARSDRLSFGVKLTREFEGIRSLFGR